MSNLTGGSSIEINPSADGEGSIIRYKLIILLNYYQ